ncbi:MAG: hypothetical protein E6Q88_07150 [Lysobacteraceae bacterium]|nr:MAG: hypothetical protein E6Q88_07150 [Xanthomonadaceae bacterium]
MFGSIVEWWRRRREARLEALMFERKVIVSFDAARVSVNYPGEALRSIAWSEVERVAIETNDSGPWGADVWWLLEGRDTRVAYPQGATGDLDLLDAYSEQFPEFDHSAVIQAMGCATNARFVCWRRDGERSPTVETEP